MVLKEKTKSNKKKMNGNNMDKVITHKIPKLSIMVVTYNQEQYIAKCLDSILQQEVNFDYEVIIGDDCSTDTTGLILDRYAAKNSCIRVQHHIRNLGHVKNWEYCLNMCHGEYIAILEGDDYWIDVHKLQRQVDYLDSHPQTVLTITNVKIVWEENLKNTRSFQFESMGEFLRAKENVCSSWYILSSSSMFRNIFHDFKFPRDVYIADSYLFPFLLDYTNGLTYAFPEQMTAYRQHNNNFCRQKSVETLISLVKQNMYYERCFPWAAEACKKTVDTYLEQLVFATGRNVWKYRLKYVVKHPCKLFSKSFVKRLVKTIAQSSF